MALYSLLYKSGELKNRADIFSKHLLKCELCPHRCGADRSKDNLGICRAGSRAKIYSSQLHFGEEPAISGQKGSGTIFFSYCTGRCIYCQNWRFSQNGEGKEVSEKELAQIMLELHNKGSHNINLVTPTHFLPQIIRAICLAAELGLKIPIVYNTSGYERVEILKLLDGIVDIYLPDMRYFEDGYGLKFSGFPEYGRINRPALKEMFRQVGNLEIDNGIAKKGLLIRHLILPNNISDTDKVLHFIAQELSPDCFVSLMSQYYPFYCAAKEASLSRPISNQEYQGALGAMHRAGLSNGWIQDDVDEDTRKRFAG
ncbi:MAG: radical SAM protein, partial [Candidatus Omnitrophica bacterium]|nr:radical SAM protein [Candidatus Omnitrophota bacterium]